MPLVVRFTSRSRETRWSPRGGAAAKALKSQAVAGAFAATFLIMSRDCSSPDWNISRMMSQPPTNSPLT
jgi:hypothetical protein